MSQNIAASKFRVCAKCGYEADTAETKCPQCGRNLQTKTKVKILGVVILVLGISIAAMMATIMASLHIIFNQPDKLQNFTGTESDLNYITAILGSMFIVGVSFAVTGLWQIIFGKRNRILVWLSLALILAVIVLSVLFVSKVK
ncbi:MAG: hypothetical protein M3033_10960 [Acidobacteriota bacterium]|nr:hypothetical protein [Acidobacteriota bacterium]